MRASWTSPLEPEWAKPTLSGRVIALPSPKAQESEMFFACGGEKTALPRRRIDRRPDWTGPEPLVKHRTNQEARDMF
jgi:hypothetical protein